MKFNKLAVAVTSAVLLMAGNVALADSTSDIVNVLVDKGILTPEEGKLISKNSVEEKKKAQASSGKIKISDAIDSATVYGDVRVRYEGRSGDAPNATNTELSRGRYKVTLGVLTNSGDWYSDLALAMGAKGRSDNANFGNNNAKVNSVSVGQEIDGKQGVFVKRAMLGWKATDWLTVEAGRMANPIYTSSMVWDADLNVEGLAEKFKYSMGNTDLFATFVQNEYSGTRYLYNNLAPKADSGNNAGAYGTSEQFIFQGGAHYAANSNLAGKAAITYTTYSKNPYATAFGNAATQNFATDTTGLNVWGVNNLNVWEIPAEVNWMVSDLSLIHI